MHQLRVLLLPGCYAGSVTGFTDMAYVISANPALHARLGAR